jgi:hypothetical protein
MDGDTEIIALLLGEPAGRWQPHQFVEGAQTLVRAPDGSVHLEPVDSAEQFDKIARTTGCFRRGKPIRDPGTWEVIGYEMEEVPVLRTALAS